MDIAVARRITTAQNKQLPVVGAKDRLAVRHEQAVAQRLPKIVSKEDIDPAGHGGIAELRYGVRIERGNLINPDALGAEETRHFRYDRTATAVTDQMDGQLREGPATHFRNKSGREQRAYGG